MNERDASWWAQQSTGVKFSIIGGSIALVIVGGIVISRMMKSKQDASDDYE